MKFAAEALFLSIRLLATREAAEAGGGQVVLTALIGRPHCTEGTGSQPDSVLNGKRTLLLDPLKSTVGKCFATQ